MQAAVPATYEDLFTEYFDYIKALVRRFGIQDADDEDVASTILLKFYEQDFLAKFEPELKIASSGGTVRQAKFTNFLTGFVAKYVLQEKDKQATRMRKEPIHLETEIGSEGTLWVELFGPTTEIDSSDLEFQQKVKGAYEYLKTIPVKQTRDLAKIFMIVVGQVILDGHVDRRSIAKEFGISDTAMCLHFKALRQELEVYGFAT